MSGKTLDENLKYISVRNQWGCQKLPKTVLAAEGKELLLVTGCRLVVYDEEEGVSGERRLLAPAPYVQSIVAVNISPCKKLAAVCVQRGAGTGGLVGPGVPAPNRAVALVYDLPACRVHPDTQPHMLMHEDSSPLCCATSTEDGCYFSGAVFSSDSKLLACYSTERKHLGVLIFDWKLRRLVHTVKVLGGGGVHCVSFNPEHSSRICVGGSGGMLQFWHYTTKNAYNAPIEGLATGTGLAASYTAHAWLSSEVLIAGTGVGALQLVVGCEVKATCNVFGNSAPYVQTPVADLLVKTPLEGASGSGGGGVDGALVLAYSREGFVSVSRVTRSQGRGAGGCCYQIVQQYHCLLQNSPRISGLAWRISPIDSSSVDGGDGSSTDGMVVTVASEGTLHTYDLALHMQHMLVPPSTLQDKGEEAKGEVKEDWQVALERQRAALLMFWEDNEQARLAWPSMPSSRCVMSFHSGSVKHLAASTRSSLLMSSSTSDCSLRLWDYNRVESSERLTLSYKQNLSELPLALDIHPSGFFVATGTEDFATEHAVTNNKLEALRRIPMKMALEKAGTGEAVHNTAHVSIVRYSRGGHLLAVVTGKLAQVFRLNHLNYHFEKTGVPQCLMTMTDHHAPITDLVFNNDDSKLFTSSADGQVFEWTVSAATTRRDKDFFLKNMSATQVAVSPSNAYIMASFRHMQGQKPIVKQMSDLSLNINPSLSMSKNEMTPSRTPNRTRRESQESTLRRRLSKTPSQGGADEQGGGTTGQSFLVMWRDTITSDGVGEVVLELEVPVTAICFGKLDGRQSPEVCLLGLANGSVLISMLPLPLRAFVPSVAKNLPSSAMGGHPFGSFSSRDQGSFRGMDTVGGDRKGPGRLDVGGGMPRSQGGVLAACDSMGMDDFFDIAPVREKKAGGEGGSNDFTNTAGSTGGGGGTLSFTATNTSSACPSPSLQQQQQPLKRTLSRSLSRGDSFSGAGAVEEIQTDMTIDESLCRVLQLHNGPVTCISMSATGLWIFTAGQDGCLFMLNSSLRSREMAEVVEAQSAENQIILTDRVSLKNSLNSLEDKDSTIEEMEKDFQKSKNELNMAKKNETEALTELMAREVAKRDDIILQGRNDLLQTRTHNSETLASVHKQYREQLAELEVMYERKLAHESLYLQNMKQAYDEFVTHARMDLEENNRKAAAREQSLNQQNEDIANMTEKNKKILLQYCEYVGERHREVLTALTETHDKDKEAMAQALRDKQEEVAAIRGDFRHEKAKTKRELHKLGAQMTAKDMEVLNTAQELERAKDRAARLESALQTAMDDIGRKQDALTRWEFKSGEQQQKLSELERVRKALVSQLHALREEMGPKDMKIIRTEDKLHEVDREYDKSIKAISEKEQKLAQNSNTLNLMNKQVRELRLSVTNKEKALKRASQLLDEFNYSLQQARFLSHKTTVAKAGGAASEGGVQEKGGGGGAEDSCGLEEVVHQDGEGGVALAPGQVGLPRGTKKTGKLSLGGPGGEIVELISSTPAMEMALQRLYDVLHPHLDIEDGGLGDEQKVIHEKDRQIAVLRNNIAGLKTNIKLNESVANLKIHNYLSNNENLNEEMNAMRKNISKLSMENDALKAFIANEERARNARKPAEMLTVDGETANTRLPPFTQKVIPASMPEPLVSMSVSERESGMGVSAGGSSVSSSSRPELPTRSVNTSKDRDNSSATSNSETRAEKMINDLFLANTIAIAEESMRAGRLKDAQPFPGSTSPGSADPGIGSGFSHTAGKLGHGRGGGWPRMGAPLLDPRKTGGGGSFSQSGQVPVVALGFAEEEKLRRKEGGLRFSTKAIDYNRAAVAAKGKKAGRGEAAAAIRLNNNPSAPSLQQQVGGASLSATTNSSPAQMSQSQSAIQFPKLSKTSK